MNGYRFRLSVAFIGIFLTTFILSGCSKEVIEPAFSTQYDASIKTLDDEYIYNCLFNEGADFPSDVKKGLIRNLNTTFILCDYVEVDGDGYRLTISKTDAKKIGIPEERYNFFTNMLEHQKELVIIYKAEKPSFETPDFRANHQKQRAQLFPEGYKPRKPIEK